MIYEDDDDDDDDDMMMIIMTMIPREATAEGYRVKQDL